MHGVFFSISRFPSNSSRFPRTQNRSSRMNIRTFVTLRTATANDREQIYALRHAVYAEELHQHARNNDQRLVDALDDTNVYLIAEAGGELAGFISITPPSAPRFSVEEYIPCSEL